MRRVFQLRPFETSGTAAMTRYADGLVRSAPELEVHSALANFLDPPRAVRRAAGPLRHWPGFREELEHEGPFDLAHLTAHWLSHHVHAFRGRMPAVITCHDLIDISRETWHFDFRRPWHVADWGRLRFSYRSLHDADVVLAISHTTKRRIAERGLAREEQIAQAYPVLSQVFLDAERRPAGHDPFPEIPHPRLIAVGNSNRHKNVQLAIRALARPGLRGAVLIRVGHPLPKDLLELARRLGVAERVHELRGVDDERLIALYRSGDVLVQPSLDEGFGYPAAEAMACGLPVVCSDGGALPEVVGDAAVVVSLAGNDEDTVVRFAEAVEMVLSDASRRGELVDAGRARVKLFTPEAQRGPLLAAYARAVERYGSC